MQNIFRCLVRHLTAFTIYVLKLIRLRISNFKKTYTRIELGRRISNYHSWNCIVWTVPRHPHRLHPHPRNLALPFLVCVNLEFLFFIYQF
jgi:hypothetical protein